jgi:hypothetical protein
VQGFVPSLFADLAWQLPRTFGRFRFFTAAIEKGKGEQMKPLWQIADFVRELRRQLRFGEFSRAPLQLLRLELHDKALACDWMARPGDVWDRDLRQHVRDRNESQQALADAITIRDLVFSELPEVKNALLRAFRYSAAREPPKLIIAGAIARHDPAVAGGASLIMRAKLNGFRFSLEGERLEAISAEEFQLSF